MREPGGGMDFQRTVYNVTSSKLTENLKLIFLSDLHSEEYGTDNEVLLGRIASEKPDLILCGGDMIISREHGEFRKAMIFLIRLSKIAPVVLANGNHESEMRKFAKRYALWTELLQRAEITVVNNENRLLKVKNQDIRVYGLELSLSKYRKLKVPHLSLGELEEYVGPSPVEREEFTILLAHNPQFMDLYLQWGADLTLSGHFHGGIMRLWKNTVLMSPYGFPVPKYGYGRMDEYGHCGIVTSGLGDHVMPLRIHNPREYVVIQLRANCPEPYRKN